MALINFYGTECPHCQRMRKLLDKLEKEKNVKVEDVEVWHNEVNMRRLETCDKERCGGVPFFYNTDNDKWLCGEVTYKELIDWAAGK